jgi:hypothetical protein
MSGLTGRHHSRRVGRTDARRGRALALQCIHPVTRQTGHQNWPWDALDAPRKDANGAMAGKRQLFAWAERYADAELTVEGETNVFCDL